MDWRNEREEIIINFISNYMIYIFLFF